MELNFIEEFWSNKLIGFTASFMDLAPHHHPSLHLSPPPTLLSFPLLCVSCSLSFFLSISPLLFFFLPTLSFIFGLSLPLFGRSSPNHFGVAPYDEFQGRKRHCENNESQFVFTPLPRWDKDEHFSDIFHPRRRKWGDLFCSNLHVLVHQYMHACTHKCQVPSTNEMQCECTLENGACQRWELAPLIHNSLTVLHTHLIHIQ